MLQNFSYVILYLLQLLADYKLSESTTDSLKEYFKVILAQ